MNTPSKMRIALTFDDGPAAHTTRLLDLFARYGGKATFFLTGACIEGQQDILRRMVAQGHEIGIHGWDHQDLTTLTAEEAARQIMRTRAAIREAIGADTRLVRPPYGSVNPTLQAVGQQLGVAFINWSVITMDWELLNAEAVCHQILSQASDGAIVLCHDPHPTTVDAIERALPSLLAQGYEPMTVSSLLFSATPPQAGNLYPEA